jgi:hypothetical protein
MLGVAGWASAANLNTSINLDGKGQFNDPGAPDGREGGEDVGTAFPIPALPFNDTGTTTGHVNDYDEICPYSGSTSADVVYSYTPAGNEAITVDLCASDYDTKVYIYAGGPGNLVACNDDAGCGYSGYQSLLENVALSGGTTYYIVVDGYGGSTGGYVMSIQGFQPCVVECPAGAQQEGEPPCGTDYYDEYNGGCNSVGWTMVPGDAQGCATVCGKSGTYLYQGSSYRDTDWFELTAAGGVANASCTAEFPLQFIFIYGPDCNNLGYDLGTGGPCTPVSLSSNLTAGATFWLWVGAQVFTGIDCDSDYVMDVCGIEGGVPTVEKTWGSIKNSYK